MTPVARIDMVDLAARHASAADEVERRVLDVLRGGRYVRGPVVAEVEALVARWFGRPAAVGVASGTDALILGLQALGVGPGHEVIVPALTFFATAGAVCAAGAVPVPVDVDGRGLIDPEAARRAVGPRTRAAIPVHLFGNRAPALSDLGVPVLDDAAQAVGAEPAPSVGRLTAISVYPTKVWGAAGDGGFAVGEAGDVDAVRRLGHHGESGAGCTRVRGAVGRNSRLDAIQAAVLLGHAPRLAERVARRRALAAYYDAHLPDWVRPVPRDPGSAVQVYAVRTDRARATAALDAAGIGWAAYYDRTIPDHPAIGRRAPTPVADRLARELLALPVHAGLTEADAARVCRALGSA